MDWSLWRLSIALAVLLVVVQLIGMNARRLTLRAEQKRLDTAMRVQLQTIFPSTPVTLDPPAQIRRQVEQLRLTAGKSAPGDSLPLVDRFVQAATGLVPGALPAFDHHGRALTVTLKDGTDTASLRAAARNVGLDMDAVEVPRGTEATVPGSHWTVSIAQQRVFYGDIFLFLPIVIPPSVAYWCVGPGVRCGHDVLDAARIA